MKEGWENYLRLGIVHFMAYPEALSGEGNIAETVREIAEDEFFQVIEISWIKDREERKRVREILDTSHLSVIYGAQPRILIKKRNLHDFDEEKRSRAIVEMREAINEAGYMNAEKVILLSGPYPGKKEERKAVKLFLDSLREICAFASEKNIDISLEVLDQDVDKKCLIGNLGLAKEITQELRKEYPSFGLTMDLSNFPLLGLSLEKGLQEVKEEIVHIHLGNCVLKEPSHPAFGDAHPRFGISGGEIDVEEVKIFLKGLFSIGYLGEEKEPLPGVSFEVKPLPGELSSLVIANAKRVFKEAWRRL